jgi:hypothetical protein
MHHRILQGIYRLSPSGVAEHDVEPLLALSAAYGDVDFRAGSLAIDVIA